MLYLQKLYSCTLIVGNIVFLQVNYYPFGGDSPASLKAFKGS